MGSEVQRSRVVLEARRSRPESATVTTLEARIPAEAVRRTAASRRCIPAVVRKAAERDHLRRSCRTSWETQQEPASRTGIQGLVPDHHSRRRKDLRRTANTENKAHSAVAPRREDFAGYAAVEYRDPQALCG